jgi:hypothetical protein
MSCSRNTDLTSLRVITRGFEGLLEGVPETPKDPPRNVFPRVRPFRKEGWQRCLFFGGPCRRWRHGPVSSRRAQAGKDPDKTGLPAGASARPVLIYLEPPRQIRAAPFFFTAGASARGDLQNPAGPGRHRHAVFCGRGGESNPPALAAGNIRSITGAPIFPESLLMSKRDLRLLTGSSRCESAAGSFSLGWNRVPPGLISPHRVVRLHLPGFSEPDSLESPVRPERSRVRPFFQRRW